MGGASPQWERAVVGLDLAGGRLLHRRGVRIRNNDFVAEAVETWAHPLAGRGAVDEHAGPRVRLPGPPSEALGLGANALLDDLTALGLEVDLAFPLVHVDTT